MTKILKRKTVQIAALWIVAVIISNVSFYFIWREWPSTNDIVIGHTVYTLLALPFSFVHTAIFYNEPALKIFGIAFLGLLLVYWSLIIYLHVKYFKTGDRKYFLILSAFLLISSIRWLYYSMGMFGI